MRVVLLLALALVLSVAEVPEAGSAASSTPTINEAVAAKMAPEDKVVLQQQIASVQKLFDGSCSSGDYDLSALAGTDFPGTDGSFNYKLRVCGTSSESACAAKQGSLCQYQTAAPNAFVHMLASWTTGPATWSPIDPNNAAKGVQVDFDNGDNCYNMGQTAPRNVNFQFTCNPGGGNGGTYTIATQTNPNNPCNYIVTFPTAASCPGGGGGGGGGSGSGSKLSGGTIFIIILIVVIPVYIIGGCIYKRQRHGQSGLEACPNIDFWRDLPSLVKDGFVFTWNKLRACCGKGETGYDSVK